jgi:hypothetical protein
MPTLLRNDFRNAADTALVLDFNYGYPLPVINPNQSETDNLCPVRHLSEEPDIKRADQLDECIFELALASGLRFCENQR